MQTDANPGAGNADRGEKPSATEVIELFYERIYALLRRLSGNDADAADLTQRTFARVWQALPDLRAAPRWDRGCTASLTTPTLIGGEATIWRSRVLPSGGRTGADSGYERKRISMGDPTQGYPRHEFGVRG
jgi:hypothetical protein